MCGVIPVGSALFRQACVVQRFELFIGGKEVVNAYVELNDPDIQLQRFGMQAKVREGLATQRSARCRCCSG
jgi:lysyl-tRNA synthetase class 2